MMGAAELGLNQPDACTSKACEWNQAFCKQVKPEELQKINFRKPRISKNWKRAPPTRKCSRNSSSSSTDEDLWAIMSEAAPNAVVLQMLSQPSLSIEPIDGSCIDVESDLDVFDNPLPDIPEDIIAIVERSSATTDLVQDICTSVTKEQSCSVFLKTTGQSADQVWHQVRHNRITASKMGDVISFMNSARTMPSTTLMNSIVGPPEDLSHVPAIRWGMEHEEEAIQEYLEVMDDHENVTFKKCGVLIPPGDAYLGATPDGLFTCQCCEDRVIEVKCPYTVACKGLDPAEGVEDGYITFLNEDGCLKTEHKYYTQVQAQMALLETGECDFVVWTPDGFSVETIPFDSTYWIASKEKLKKFYFKHIVPNLLASVNKPPFQLPTPPTLKKGKLAPSENTSPLQPPGKRRKIFPKNPCTVCGRSAGKQSVACNKCEEWVHLKCVGLKGDKNSLLTSPGWLCISCKENQEPCFRPDGTCDL